MKKHIRLFLLILVIGLAIRFSMLDSDSLTPSQAFSRQQSKPASSSSGFLGSKACVNCHTEIADKYRHTAMAGAMEKIEDCQILRSHPEMKFQKGIYKYTISRKGELILYTVSDGNSELSVPLLYSFGKGKLGQTYVYEYKGAWYEGRVSYYSGIDGLDITLGDEIETPSSLPDALGRRISVDETKRCFGCHSTGAAPVTATITKAQLDQFVPGVGCESCHGSGEKHVISMQTTNQDSVRMKKLGELDGDDISQNMCATCHRSAEDIMELPSRGGISNIRFQPYRIFNSRCYSADKRIGCTACHDPHDKTASNAAYYDSKCVACHRTNDKPKEKSSDITPPRKTLSHFAAACRVERKDCASCHMPKVELPGSHYKFTDHRIRITRPGAPFPN